MAFAGKVWRLLVGIKDALVLLFMLIFFALLFAALSARPSPTQIRNGALLLDLNGAVVEEKSSIDPLSTLLSSSIPVQQYAAQDIIRAIDSAAADERINALALDLTTFAGGGQVHMQSIADAIDRFRTAKKPVLTYAVAYSDDAMMLAAHASEVWVDPMGGAAITGPGGTNLYYAGLLNKLKVKAHVFRVGTYKSAVEPYLRDGMSPAARENAEALYGAIWEEWKADVKQARPQADITLVTENIGDWLTQSKGDLAAATLAAGLADRTGTRVEWGKRLAQISGEDDWDRSPGAFAKNDYADYLGTLPVSSDGKAIGIITVDGEISDGDAGPGSAGAERITRLLDDALDRDLAALVVRVNSPGGTVTGSEAIRRAILRQKERNIPVIVSMGNVAASGGYWISTAGDRIFAEPETITGSIGIFGVLPTFEDALAEWGVTSDGVRTTPLSGQPDILGGLTPETETLVQSTIEYGYRRFVNLVSKARNMEPSRVDEIAQGRVWDGGSALQLGLVDQFGDLDTAIAYAAKSAQAGDDWHVEYLADKPDPYEQMIEQWLLGTSQSSAPQGMDMMGHFARAQQDAATRIADDLDSLMAVKGLQARCLECPAMPLRQRNDASSISGQSLFKRALFSSLMGS
ncbi:signal peptide peptidase SppA [Altericroceibacterium endophyticum]|uniref:Signal peptide peptidase SppA n=1 Tax=Altericroceibacterium endophyticum TaxID=1808508 RepID=A0A6I4T7Y1_9SPHN|nr:signal peptide peptidase SppA [Altericroceibacterium endophyticum]MXO66579.1 signal peptide peptidase SppA [Altericroceibacterium endophyticum]